MPHFEWNGVKCLSLIDRGREPAWFLAVADHLPSVTERNSGRGFQPHLGRAESSLHPARPSRWPYKSSMCLRCLKHSAWRAEVRLLPTCPNITPRTWRSAEKSRHESSSAWFTQMDLWWKPERLWCGLCSLDVVLKCCNPCFWGVGFCFCFLVAYAAILSCEEMSLEWPISSSIEEVCHFCIGWKSTVFEREVRSSGKC